MYKYKWDSAYDPGYKVWNHDQETHIVALFIQESEARWFCLERNDSVERADTDALCMICGRSAPCIINVCSDCRH